MEIAQDVTLSMPATQPTEGEPPAIDESAQIPESPDTQDQQDAGETETAAADKPRGVGKRIDELTKLRRDAERDRDYWRELALRQAEAKQQAQPEAQVQPQPPQKPREGDYETYEAYVEAVAEYKAEMKFEELRRREHEQYQAYQRQQRQADAQQEFQSKATTFLAKKDAFAAGISDYDELTTDPSLPINPVMRDCVIESDLGPQIVYWLAKNRDEAVRISQMSPLAAAREIGRIEQRLGSVKPPGKKTTSAPEPINPIGGGVSTVHKKPEEMTNKEYWAWRDKQEYGK